ncbi:hypothetical protein [Amycolatopsis rhizosphaerae]|uniref:hypothetical protein n=1 Tax=Amycolatopsis rhizosphaerae TaxID=2053003 RepID=UPI001C97AEC1|nr:hypothetical protein [Amycolatopsis rhizosphaerae]
MAIIRSELILIGYWRRKAGRGWPADDRWPSPEDFVDSSWDADERDQVVDYLGRGFIVRACMGLSPCRMCGRANGALELSDGVYVWPEGLKHYVEDHDVRLPEPFTSHVLASIEAFETAGRDESWWRSFVG